MPLYGLLLAALPEFLGSLCATLVFTIGTWAVRKARSRAISGDDRMTPGDE